MNAPLHALPPLLKGGQGRTQAHELLEAWPGLFRICLFSLLIGAAVVALQVVEKHQAQQATIAHMKGNP